MFSRPLEDFTRRLRVFVDDFHTGRLTDAKRAAFKTAFQALSLSDKRTIHLEVTVLTSRTARDTPNLTKTGVLLFMFLYFATTLGVYMNNLRSDPVPTEHLIDTHGEVMVVWMALLLLIRLYHQDSYMNQYNLAAHAAALQLMDEVLFPVSACDADEPYVPQPFSL